jgi:hypothetical protein
MDTQPKWFTTEATDEVQKLHKLKYYWRECGRSGYLDLACAGIYAA